MTVALTGGEMTAKVGDRLLQWNATHTLNAGDIIELSAPKSGVYGYVTPHASLPRHGFLIASRATSAQVWAIGCRSAM
jgi:allophanate hydrolase subunit 2